MRFEGSKNHTVFPVYLAFLLDSFGLAIIYPILTPLFLRPDFAIFLPEYTLAARISLLGLTIAAFPLAQFFGAPLIGELSDRIGRKRSFIGTISGTAFGYFITALGILSTSLPLLLIGRLWTGFFAGNLTLCLAAIADFSPDAPTRTRNFGHLASLGGISFVLGILIGGTFAGATLDRGINPSVPFWLMTFLSIINLLLIYLFYQDPLSKATVGQLNIWRGIQNLASAFKERKLRQMYLVYFFFIISWVTSMQFVSTFLIRVYNVSSPTLEISLVSVGTIWALTNGFLAKRLSTVLKTTQVLLICLPLLSILLIISAFATPLWLFLSAFSLAVLCSALAWTNCLCSVSMRAEGKIQGRVLGINQSIGALASICGPIIGGLLAGFGIFWIYLFAAFSAITAIFFLLHEIKSKKLT